MTTSFFVAGVIEQLATRFSLNAGTDGIDDTCWGVMLNSQATYSQFLTKHAGPYNYLIIDDIINDAPMIRILRREVNAGIEIDAAVNQKDCIWRSAEQPVIRYARVDPASLPRSVELQYISFDRNFAVNTQYARNEGARVQQNTYSAAVDFILSDSQARDMAYDLLWRIWMQQLSVNFEHPDLYIEAGDIIQMTTDQGVYVVQVTTSLITKEPNSQSDYGRTNQLTASLLLTRRGATVNPGQAQLGSGSSTGSTGIFHVVTYPTVVGVGDPPAPGFGEFTIAAAISQNTAGEEEGLPKDLPESFDWYHGYILDFVSPPSYFTAMTGYGHLYQKLGTSDATIPGVLEVRNQKSWVQLTDFSWVEVQDETLLNGAHFVGDFAGNESIPMDLNDIGGGIWTMDGPPITYNNHWWMDGRGVYTAGTVRAAFTFYEIRCTEPSASGRIVAGAGIDWWLDATAGYIDPVGTNNPAAGIGNWVVVTSEFKPVCFYSNATSADFAAHPPPNPPVVP